MFTNCKTLEELKREYHKLVMINHPDRGGDTAKMQQINLAYEKFFSLLKNKHAKADGEAYEKETEETPEMFKDLLEKLIHFEDCTIEIIGCFIWVSGNTKAYKEMLKEMGFKWSSKKLCWYKSPEGYKRFGKKNYDLDEIRGMYGSENVKTKPTLKIEGVA